MAVSAGDMLLEALRSQGVDCIFCSPGSEWVPVWEGLARRYCQGDRTMRYFDCRHEGTAVSAAAGYAQASDRLPAVLLHTGVGLLHAAMEIRTAYRSRSPMVICAGDSSHYGDDETGRNAQWLGHLTDVWGPASLVRPYVKWSNSVTSVAGLLDSINRGCQIARSVPRGPVLLSMPWELMVETHPEMKPIPAARPVATPDPCPGELDEVARRLLDSQHPIIITEYAGERPGAVPRLVELAELLSIPVFESNDPRFSNFPQSHPLHAGYDASKALQEADMVVIAGGTTPWHPPSAYPRDGAFVALLDEVLLKEQLPYWGYRVDLMVAGNLAHSLATLADAVRRHRPADAGPRYQKRFEHWRDSHEIMVQRWEAEALAERRNKPISPKWLLHTLSKTLPGDSLILDETVTHRILVRRYLAAPDTYFKVSSGGLGNGLGMAAGVKLARPEKPVVLLIGDGTFNYNPVPGGFGVYQQYGLPVLTVVFCNGKYIAMQRGYRECYPEGWAARSNTYLGVDIAPEPDYAKLIEAFDGCGQRVADPDEIAPAVGKALEHLAKGKSALLNVILES